MKLFKRHTIANTWLGQALNHLVGAFDMRVISYYNDPELIRLIRRVRHEDGRFLFRPSELVMVYSLAKASRGISGDFAEVGVFRGTSATMICEAKGDKSLFLFDTFAGLPETGEGDDRFSEHQFHADINIVRRRLDNYPGVFIVPGIFPRSGECLRDRRFSFVHMDVDLYESTLKSLEFFYNRMNAGGIILSHDYAQAGGVRRAFDEFFAGRPERVVRLPMSQCMVVCGLEMPVQAVERVEGLLHAIVQQHFPRVQVPEIPPDAVVIEPGDCGQENEVKKPMVIHFDAPEGEWDHIRALTGLLAAGSEPDQLVLVIHRNQQSEKALPDSQEKTSWKKPVALTGKSGKDQL